MEIKPPTRSEKEELVQFFVQEGRRHKMEVSSCAEGSWMGEYGVETAGCFTKDVWEKCCGKRLNILYYTNEDMKISGWIENVRYMGN